MKPTGITYKGLIAIIDAIEFRIASYEHQLISPELTDDEAGDISNDKAFLKSLLKEFKQELEFLIKNNAVKE
jgi:hypothetical protein